MSGECRALQGPSALRSCRQMIGSMSNSHSPGWWLVGQTCAQ
jgi:hypothetical protein